MAAAGSGRDVWRENSPDSLLDLATRLIYFHIHFIFTFTAGPCHQVDSLSLQFRLKTQDPVNPLTSPTSLYPPLPILPCHWQPLTTRFCLHHQHVFTHQLPSGALALQVTQNSSTNVDQITFRTSCICRWSFVSSS